MAVMIKSYIKTVAPGLLDRFPVVFCIGKTTQEHFSRGSSQSGDMSLKCQFQIFYKKSLIKKGSSLVHLFYICVIIYLQFIVLLLCCVSASCSLMVPTSCHFISFLLLLYVSVST